VRRHRRRGPARFARPAGTFARTTSSLNAAAAAGDLGAIRAALDAGAPVDGAPDDDHCPLFEAVWAFLVGAVRELLAPEARATNAPPRRPPPAPSARPTEDAVALGLTAR